MEECIICYNNIKEKEIYHKWSCKHENYKCCKKCIINLDICPICRNDEYKLNVFNIYVNNKDYTKKYKDRYYFNLCVSNNHNIKIVKPSKTRITVLCQTCDSIMHYYTRK